MQWSSDGFDDKVGRRHTVEHAEMTPTPRYGTHWYFNIIYFCHRHNCVCRNLESKQRLSAKLQRVLLTTPQNRGVNTKHRLIEPISELFRRSRWEQITSQVCCISNKSCSMQYRRLRRSANRQPFYYNGTDSPSKAH